MIRIKRLRFNMSLMIKLFLFAHHVEKEPTREAILKGAALFFKRKNNILFEEIKSTLRWMNGGSELCVYCLTNQGRKIDHFRPQEKFPKEALSWPNFIWACSRCILKKSDKFPIKDKEPLLIDPTREDPARFIFYQPTGKFREFKNEVDDPERLSLNELKNDVTIETLGLNHPELNKARRSQWLVIKHFMPIYLANRTTKALEFFEAKQILTSPPALAMLAFFWKHREEPDWITPSICDYLKQMPEVESWIDYRRRSYNSFHAAWSGFLEKRVANAVFSQNKVRFTFYHEKKKLLLPCGDPAVWTNERLSTFHNLKLKRFTLDEEIHFIFKAKNGPTYSFDPNLLEDLRIFKSQPAL